MAEKNTNPYDNHGNSYPTKCTTCGKGIGWDHVRVTGMNGTSAYCNNGICEPPLVGTKQPGLSKSVDGRYPNNAETGTNYGDKKPPKKRPPSTGGAALKSKPKKPTGSGAQSLAPNPMGPAKAKPGF